MPISETPMVERVARVLAAYHLSVNARGGEPHAGLSVDIEWEDRIDEALAILRVMREPDRTMAQTGDADIWERMIAATLAEAEQDETLFRG